MKILIFIMVSVLFVNCQKENEDFEETKSKFIGEWFEIEPCDSCSTITFFDDNTLSINNHNSGITLNANFELLSTSEIKLNRLWEVEETKKANSSNFTFISPDTLLIEDFSAVDYGVENYVSIKLKKK